MTITTKKTSNGATIYYADGKRVAKAIAIKTAKENNINIIDANTVDTNDNAGAKATDLTDIETNVKNAYAAMIAAEESAPPVADANRPVKTFATKEIKNKVYYYDKKTGKKISKAKALASTNLTALKEITAAFNRNGKTYDYYEDDLTVGVTVDSYEKAIDALNAAIMVITGKPADLSEAKQDTNGSIRHYLGGGLTVSEFVGSDNHLHIHIDWAQDGHNYNDLCCKYDFEGSYRIKVAPVSNTPEPNGGNDKDNGNDSDSDKGNDSDNTVETAQPIISANRPVQTYYMKYVDGTFYYFDKKTGKQISEDN